VVARAIATCSSETHLQREGDGVRVRQEQLLQLGNGQDAEVLVFDLRPHELPGMP
jgi:hypothetical protein